MVGQFLISHRHAITQASRLSDDLQVVYIYTIRSITSTLCAPSTKPARSSPTYTDTTLVWPLNIPTGTVVRALSCSALFGDTGKNERGEGRNALVSSKQLTRAEVQRGPDQTTTGSH